MKITRKNIIQFALFGMIMLLTFYTLFQKHDIGRIITEIQQMTVRSIFCAVLLSVFFVSAEGIMIWYLLSALGNSCKVRQCVSYSFIGFFYSGITPSATGGQPMQLYYMKKDSLPTSDSSVILMIVALAYKLVLVVIGLGILLVWRTPLCSYLKGYMLLYYIGILLNLGVVLVLIGVMVFPRILLKIAFFLDSVIIRLHLWKPSKIRRQRIEHFIDSYQLAVEFISKHRTKLLFIGIITLLQRSSMFLLTFVIYQGFPLGGASLWEIMALQAAVYIAVDMLPIPGAQGITELVYQTTFAEIFTAQYLVPSMMVIRGINFYLLLIICGGIAGWTAWKQGNAKQ